MVSLQNIIKYLGLAVIFYFLIKAFANNKLTNTQIVIVVLLIMIFVIFIASQNFNCPNKIEGYQPTNTLIKFPAAYNMDESLDNTVNDDNSDNIDYVDDDIKDFKDIIDNQKYQNIKNNEMEVKNNIRSKYKYDMIYTQTNPLNTVPLGSQLYGYTYLPPENWFRAYEKPPVCITDKRCAICPISDPSIAGLMEFDSSSNIIDPLDVDYNYTKKVLNKNTDY